MNDVAAIRMVFPKHPTKMLSAIMGVPIGTAREWLYRRFSASRRRELAVALLAEMDEQDRRRAALRTHLKRLAGDGDDAEMGGVLAGGSVQDDRRTEGGAPAGGVRGGVADDAIDHAVARR